MSQRMWVVGVSVSAFLSIMLLSLILAVSYVSAQEENAIFSVSPGEFTVRDAPPEGAPYTLPQVLIVWNRDNIDRVVLVTVEVPPENLVRSGYEPIPEENWVRPFPSSVLIPENSYAEIQISMNIPRWENLTGQKWEVWIPVERQPLPGEVGVLRPTVRMKIETTKELPAESEGGAGFPVLLVLGISIAIVVIAVVAWILSRRRGRRGMGRGVLSRRWR